MGNRLSFRLSILIFDCSYFFFFAAFFFFLAAMFVTSDQFLVLIAVTVSTNGRLS